MKTVIEALNEVKGDLTLFYATYSLALSGVELVSVDMVIKQLENWQPTLSVSPLDNVTYAEYKAPFMNENKESKPELDTVDGMQHEIGKLYEFSDDPDFRSYALLILTGFDGSRFSADGFKWKRCREINPSKLGKITPAPIDLVDGAAYAFEYQDEDMLGRYHKGTNRFIIGNSNVKRAKVKNITPLVPEALS
jgi:hypothetical protein